MKAKNNIDKAKIISKVFKEINITNKAKNQNILIVRVGSDERLARSEDINAVKEILEKLENMKGNSHLITHHLVNIDKITVPKGGILLVKFGSDENPASQEDLDSLGEIISKVKDCENFTLVTRHDIEFEIINKNKSLKNIIAF